MRKMLQNPAVRLICWYLVFTFSGVVLLPSMAQAAFLSHTQDLAMLDAEAIATARQALETEALTERLAALGLSADEIKARIDGLTPDERLAVMADLDGIHAGGDGLVTVLVVILLVVLILKLLDKDITIK